MSEDKKLSAVQIYYEKTPLYRTVYSDGFIGGVTPTGAVNLSFYASRNPIPKSTTHELQPDNSLDPKGKVSEDSKLGIIREVEFGVYLTKETAREMYNFLKTIIESK